MTTLWQENLKRLVALVDEKIAAAEIAEGPYSHKDHFAWRGRVRAEDDRLKVLLTEQGDARFGQRGDGYSLTMAGIRSTSTSGLRGAIANWRKAARARLELAEAESSRDASEAVVATALGFMADMLGDPINLQGSGPAPIEPREGV